MLTHLTNELDIRSYVHCGRCVEEIKAKSPETRGHSPQTYACLSVGFTPLGLQVWCYRHNINVVHIDFEGCRHPANTTAKEVSDAQSG